MSSRFTFALEPVLRLRKSHETELAAELAQARRDLERAQSRLREQERDLAIALSDLARSGARVAAEFERTAAAARSAAASCEEAVRDAQAALAAAMRDRKAIESLKSRRLAEFAAEEARKEERELDEANHR